MTGSIDDRIQHVLDGAASPEERAQLDALLAADPEARRRYDELRSLFDALTGAPAEDAPAGLHDDVMRSLPSRAGGAAVLDDGRCLGSQPFAAAAVAAVIIFVTLRGGPPVPAGRPPSGTMSGAPPAHFDSGWAQRRRAPRDAAAEAEGAARPVVSDVPTRVTFPTPWARSADRRHRLREPGDGAPRGITSSSRSAPSRTSIELRVDGRERGAAAARGDDDRRGVRGPSRSDVAAHRPGR